MGKLQDLRIFYDSYSQPTEAVWKKKFAELLRIAEKLAKTNNDLREKLDQALAVDKRRERNPHDVLNGRMRKEMMILNEVISDCLALIRFYSQGTITDTNAVYEAVRELEGEDGPNRGGRHAQQRLYNFV